VGEIESTNPCGEQPLLPYESCNLGSIDLVTLLKTEDGVVKLDFDLLKATVESAVHFLDNVIDVNNYPLERIGEMTKSTRKIGLGVMGFADALLALGIPYNSEEGVAFAERVMSFIQATGHNASKALAKSRGAFPLFSESTLKDGDPIRNATVTTIAPTGTLSIIAGCSSGVEPVFGYVYIRNVMDGTQMVEVNPLLMEKLRSLGLDSDEMFQAHRGGRHHRTHRGDTRRGTKGVRAARMISRRKRMCACRRPSSATRTTPSPKRSISPTRLRVRTFTRSICSPIEKAQGRDDLSRRQQNGPGAQHRQSQRRQSGRRNHRIRQAGAQRAAAGELRQD
jgi:hypothetical protein